jgi:hypothetical protein
MSTYCLVSGWSSHGTHVVLTIPSIIVILFYDCKVNKQSILIFVRSGLKPLLYLCMILYNNIQGITVAKGTSDAFSLDSMETSIT